MNAGATMATSEMSKFERIRFLTDSAEKWDGCATELERKLAEERLRADDLQMQFNEAHRRCVDLEKEARDAREKSDQFMRALQGDEEALAEFELIDEGDAEILPDPPVVLVEQELDLDSADSKVVELVEEEMTDEHMHYEPSGNDYAPPDRQLTSGEVARLHLPYMDQIDGPRVTHFELERFRVGSIDETRETRYRCVMCTPDVHHDVSDCKQFGGVVVCRDHSEDVFTELRHQGVRTRYFRDGQECSGHPFAHWLLGVFKHLKRNPFSSSAEERSVCDENLAREYTSLRAYRQEHLEGVAVARSVRSARSTGSRAHRISSGIEYIPADDVIVPTPTDVEGRACASEEDYFSHLVQLWRFKKNRRDQVPEDRFAGDQFVREANREERRIRVAWEQQHPEGYEWFQRRRALYDFFVRYLGQDFSDAQIKDRNDLLDEAELVQQVRFWLTRENKRQSLSAFESAVQARAAELKALEKRAEDSKRAKKITRKSVKDRSEEDKTFMDVFNAQRRAEALALQEKRKAREAAEAAAAKAEVVTETTEAEPEK